MDSEDLLHLSKALSHLLGDRCFDADNLFLNYNWFF